MPTGIAAADPAGSERCPLELFDVTTGYGDVAVVRGATMRFPERRITTITGSNGAGKSTVIKAAAGALRAWSGKVLSNGEDITGEPAYKRVSRGIGYVPQGRIVVPEMTVQDNLELGAHILKGDRSRIKAAMDRVVQTFPILGQRKKQLAGTMSGGEQQMLAIGRALMTSPGIVILDEPSLGLAPLIVKQIFEIVKELNEKDGMTVFLVEQNAYHALKLAHRGYVMVTGNITMSGTGKELLENPQVRAAYLEGGHH